MKSFKWMLAALLAVTVCTPLMAQNHKDLGAKIQRQIQLQKQKQQSAKCWRCGEKITSEDQRCAADCDVFCAPENEPQTKPQTKAVTPAKSQTKQTKSLGKCWRCGEEITSESKRCPADCDVFCDPENEPQTKPQTKAVTPAKSQTKQAKSLGKCWRCGEEITSEDQRCAADCDVFCAPENEPQAKSLGKCWRCGEEIMSESQRCSADCDVYCAPKSNTQQATPKTQKKAKSKKVKKAVKQDYETCPECHAVYDDDYYFHGIHHCGFNH